MKRAIGPIHSSKAGWQPWLCSLFMVFVCIANMVMPFWHELDVEEHDVSHVECHVKDATHLHQQSETVGTHDHDHCAICQNALNRACTAGVFIFRALAEKVTLPCFWSPVREFVARVKLPIHPQAP